MPGSIVPPPVPPVPPPPPPEPEPEPEPELPVPPVPDVPVPDVPVPDFVPAGAFAVRNFAWLMLLVTGSHTWYLPAASVTVSRAVLPAASVGVFFGDIIEPMTASPCFFVPLLTTTNVTFPAVNDVGETVTLPSATETLIS